MEDRNYIINRITSKKTTLNEFKYDNLTAPPISSMFTMQDIHQLHKIATSIRYAGNPNKKYKLIDEIMNRRGFIKFVSGTNRVTYRHPEDNSFIVKVAFDDVGIKDNPKEYRNQFLLKPFCTKVFEVTNCGTLGIFERVNPITSREEFCSIAKDIYNVISYWLIGEYILEDIGTKFFMNWGVRDGFGPVLLDYPYLYELDGNKLYCKSPSPNSPTGCCDGVIDYDDGFNYLYCTKCGARYRATELAKAIKNNEIIVKGKGETKMKIRVLGGSKNVNKVFEAGQYAGVAHSIPRSRNQRNKSNNNRDNTIRVSINDGDAEPVYKSEDYESSIKVRTSKSSKKKENKKPVDKSVNGVKVFEEKVTPAIEFDTSLIENKSEKLSVKEILNMYSEEEILDMMNIQNIMKMTLDYFSDNLSSDNIDMDKKNDAAIEFAEFFIKLISIIIKDTTLLEDIAENKNDKFNKFVELISVFGFNENIISLYDKFHKIDIEEDESLALYTDPKVYNQDNEVIYEKDDYEFIRLEKEDIPVLDEPDIEEKSNNVEHCESSKDFYTGFKYYAAKVINEKDIFQDKSRCKVLAVIDEDGELVSDGDKICVIDLIDNKSVDNLSIVSTKWLDPILDKLSLDIDKDNKKSETEVIDVEASDVVYTDDSKMSTIGDSIPNGIFSPNSKAEYSVNGVKGE